MDFLLTSKLIANKVIMHHGMGVMEQLHQAMHGHAGWLGGGLSWAETLRDGESNEGYPRFKNTN